MSAQRPLLCPRCSSKVKVVETFSVPLSTDLNPLTGEWEWFCGDVLVKDLGSHIVSTGLKCPRCRNTIKLEEHLEFYEAEDDRGTCVLRVRWKEVAK